APPAPEPPPPAPPAPPTPPAPAAPPTQEPPNAPANARYDPGSGTPGKKDVPVLSDTQVGYLRKPNPVYPAFSKRAGETGKVMLRVLLDEKGTPVKIEIEESSGFPRLDQAAIAAARSSRYSPYVRDGKPQQVIARVPIVFDLE
ncbi:MAG: energy transducer TonB, partial [Lautropia sp.]|nr:energy transducer TonB [Lautropia sp.]